LRLGKPLDSALFGDIDVADDRLDNEVSVQDADIIILTPEVFFGSTAESTAVQQRCRTTACRLLVIDEVRSVGVGVSHADSGLQGHLMIQWSLMLRVAYRQLLRYLTHSKVPVYVMSGTLTRVMSMHLRQVLTTNRPSDDVVFSDAGVAVAHAEDKVSFVWQRRTRNNAVDYQQALERVRAAAAHDSRTLIILLFATFDEMNRFIEHMGATNNATDRELVNKFRSPPASRAAVGAVEGGLRSMEAYHSLVSEENRLATQRNLAAGRVCVVLGSTGVVLGVTLETSGSADNEVFVYGGVPDLCMIQQAAHRVGRMPGTGRAMCTLVNDSRDFSDALRANTNTKKLVKKDGVVSERRVRGTAVDELTRQTLLLSLLARAVTKVATGKAENNMRDVTNVCLRRVLQIDVSDALSADGKSLDLSVVRGCSCANDRRVQCVIDVRRVASGVGGSSQQPRAQHRPSEANADVLCLIARMRRQRESFAASTAEMSLFGAAGFMPDHVIVEIARDTRRAAGDSKSLVIADHWLSSFPHIRTIVGIALDDERVDVDDNHDDDGDENEHDDDDDDESEHDDDDHDDK